MGQPVATIIKTGLAGSCEARINLALTRVGPLSRFVAEQTAEAVAAGNGAPAALEAP